MTAAFAIWISGIIETIASTRTMKAGQKLWMREELIRVMNLYCKLPYYYAGIQNQDFTCAPEIQRHAIGRRLLFKTRRSRHYFTLQISA
jgi:hypothetical protein